MQPPEAIGPVFNILSAEMMPNGYKSEAHQRSTGVCGRCTPSHGIGCIVL